MNSDHIWFSKLRTRMKDTIMLFTGRRGPLKLAKRGSGCRLIPPWKITGERNISIGADTFIHKHAQIQALTEVGRQMFSPQIRIGDGVYIGQYVFIACINDISIADFCVLSDHVFLSDCSHGLNPMCGPIIAQPWESRGPIHIGYSTFVGYRAVIMPGVVLGKHCIVGANSVVTHSFPDYSMVAGVPARLVKTYSPENRQWMASADA